MAAAFVADPSRAAAFFKTPIPAHDEPPLHAVPSVVVATWPIGTFVENVHARADGSLLVSVHSAAEIHRWHDETGVQRFAKMPASPTSINASPDGGSIVLGGSIGSGPQFVWHVSDSGAVSEIARVEDALFFNGGTPFRAGHLLAADSMLGRIYDIDLAAGSAAIWYEHELLRKISSEAMLPGANGVKIFGPHVYVSNTDRALVLRIPFDDDGLPGAIEIVAERLRADDFAFDRLGNALLTTHIHNSLVRLSRSGERLGIAGADAGMAGSTAVTFGVTPATESSVFVTTTGGVLSPYDGIVQPAKLVRLDVGITGFPINFLS